MNQYYGVTRSDAYLAHYGVKGMKWGVRKALYNNDARALRKHYQKAAKKLAKLEKRGNSGAKYAARAGLLGAGAAAVGGMAFNNKAINQVSRIVAPRAKKLASSIVTKHGNTINKLLGYNTAGNQNASEMARKAIVEFDKQKQKRSRISGGSTNKPLSYYASRYNEIQKPKHYREGGTEIIKLNGRVNAPKSTSSGNTAFERKKVINNISDRDIGRAALGLTAAGLAGAAGYNAYRAATTKRARRKATEFRKAMNETFAGTEYEKLGGLPLPKQKRKRRR